MGEENVKQIQQIFTYLTVKQFCERHPAFTVGGLRWQIFHEKTSMQSLPLPQSGGELSLLWTFINIPEKDRLLVLAWMLESFRAETPKPILALAGIQGCAKSSTQSKIRELLDNNSSNLRAAPKAVEDVFISAGCNWLSSYENLSHLTPKMQDALCTLATGGGHSSRTLYTNDEETVIEAKRPVIINSIPNVITAQDLTDRSICIELPRVETAKNQNSMRPVSCQSRLFLEACLTCLLRRWRNCPR